MSADVIFICVLILSYQLISTFITVYIPVNCILLNNNMTKVGSCAQDVLFIQI